MTQKEIVTEEFQSLEIKIQNLRNWLKTDETISSTERYLAARQLYFMQRLEESLKDRLEFYSRESV